MTLDSQGPSGPTEREALSPSEGWAVLHLFFRVGHEADPEAVSRAVKACEGDDHQVLTFAVLGHKADLGVMALGPDLWRLQGLQAELAAAGLRAVSSYVSLTEVSEYAKGMPAERLEPRLHPRLPPAGKRFVCFYPMSKRRGENQNWYTLPYEEREQLMYGHGRKGREYAGRVLQLVTGSTGLDDWEWGVTLFADDPVAIKQCVYDMRFDTASAVYAEFGPFVAGLLGSVDEVLARVGLR
ncbi:MAG: chlorite dismutase family protein [Actinomycetota bacterium]|nr:chlorite dismutase family protein [Actinomycetota bacterium]